jgi:hypothetical protein
MSSDQQELRVQAEQAFHRRSLRALSDAVVDPVLRSQAQRLACGEISASTFIRYMEHSAPAIRGFDRFLNQCMRLTPDELDQIAAKHEQQIAEIAAELAACTKPSRNDEDEESWEDTSWLV